MAIYTSVSVFSSLQLIWRWREWFSLALRGMLWAGALDSAALPQPGSHGNTQGGFGASSPVPRVYTAIIGDPSQQDYLKNGCL